MAILSPRQAADVDYAEAEEAFLALCQSDQELDEEAAEEALGTMYTAAASLGTVVTSIDLSQW